MLANAIICLQNYGIAHRSISPGKVLVDTKPKLVVKIYGFIAAPRTKIRMINLELKCRTTSRPRQIGSAAARNGICMRCP